MVIVFVSSVISVLLHCHGTRAESWIVCIEQPSPTTEARFLSYEQQPGERQHVTILSKETLSGKTDYRWQIIRDANHPEHVVIREITSGKYLSSPPSGKTEAPCCLTGLCHESLWRMTIVAHDTNGKPRTTRFESLAVSGHFLNVRGGRVPNPLEVCLHPRPQPKHDEWILHHEPDDAE